MEKRCTRCNKFKDREAFYKSKGSQYKESWDCRDSMCIPCRSSYQTERRKKIKRQAVEFLGGACKDCDLETDCYDMYDFHHLDPMQKDFSIGKVVRPLEKLKPELSKCILLCANCHRKRHAT